MRTRVEDVMTRQVISVDFDTPFKDVAETLIQHGISAVPVVDADGRVAGVISEADLLRKEEFRELFYREGYRPPLRVRRRHRDAERKATGDTAYELMSAPAVSISREATVVAAARLMDEHDLKRLVVRDDDGCLVGIVSRRDLLRTFVRDDEEIAKDVREDVFERALWNDPSQVTVTVDHGIVTLNGRMDRRSSAAIAARMTQRVNGVVDVVDNLIWDEDDTPVWDGR
ncbi:CBS domain-containing protein [Nonomuraea sp. bgisy101]|uniref:CBS domain-containing protein n=1 Tax=Nonomuraea sp. bgisy101 TaxID=3413784 RepID=UPI003D748318